MTQDGSIKVDFAALKNLSQSIEDILKDITDRLDALHPRVVKVVRAWEGEARDVCVESLDKWDGAVQDMVAAQSWLHDVVVTGHINYAAAHRAVLRGWGGA